MKTPLLANLICGSPARNHDFDFARRHLLDALYAAGEIRTDVAQTYPDAGAIENINGLDTTGEDLLLVVLPEEEQREDPAQVGQYVGNHER